MSLFDRSDIENIIKGSAKIGLGSTRIINNAVRKSFRNKQLLRSTQQFSTEDLVDQLKQVANDALRLEKALGLLRQSDPKNKDIKNMTSLLNSLNDEKDVLSKKVNEALSSRDIANDVVRSIDKNKVPPRRTTSNNQPNRRTTLGNSSLNLLGTAINLAGYVSNRRQAKRGAGATSDLSSGTTSNGNSDFLRQNLKITRDTYARDKEYQEEFKKDFDKVGDNVVRRLDKIIDKLDKLKGRGGSGGGGSDLPDIDLPDKEKKERGNRRGGRRSRFGLRAGAAVAGAAGLVNGAKVIDSQGNEQTIDMNPLTDTLKFLTDPKVEGAFQSMRNTARDFLGLSSSKPNTAISTPSTSTTPPNSNVIPPNQNFGGMPGLPRLNTARPINSPEVTGSIVAGATGIAAVRTNETAIDVKPQATVIINTRDLEIKGADIRRGIGDDSNCCCSDKVVTSNTVGNAVDGGNVVFGGIGRGSGGAYSGSGVGTRAILGSRGGGRGQAFTPQGTQRQTITTNPFTGQPIMTLPSDAAGQGTAGGGIANPYGFSGTNAGNMGSMSALPGNVTGGSITSNGKPVAMGATGAAAPLLNQIFSGEGTSGTKGYNTTLGNGKFTKGSPFGDNPDLSNMTIDQVYQLQKYMKAQPGNSFPAPGGRMLPSSALGKGQIIEGTLKQAVTELGLDPSTTKFDQATQDKINEHLLLKNGGLQEYLDSDRSPEAKRRLQNKLAATWDSMPDPSTGRGRYSGSSRVSPDAVSKAIDDAAANYDNPSRMAQGGATGSPNIPEAKPGETPGQLASRIKSLNPNIGNGECVALAKQAVGLDASPGANSVSDWRKGESATSRELPIGTPVATFMDRQGNDSDKYDGGQGTGISRSKNGGLGTTHAAVVAGYEKDGNGKITGMQVWEQWNGSGGARLKTYPVDPNKPGADNAGNFYAVNDSKGNPLGGANNPLSREAVPNATASNGPVYDPTKTFGDPSKFSGTAGSSDADMSEAAGPMSLQQMNNLSVWRDEKNEKNKPTSWYQDTETGKWKPMFNNTPNPGTGTAAGANFQASNEGFKNQALGNRGFSGVNATSAFGLPEGATNVSMRTREVDIDRNLDGTWGENHSPTKENGRDLTSAEVDGLMKLNNKNSSDSFDPLGGGSNFKADPSKIAGQLEEVERLKKLGDPNPLPGEDFSDYMKRRAAGGYNIGGLAEGQIDRRAKFGEGRFSYAEKADDLTNKFADFSDPNSSMGNYGREIDSGKAVNDAATRAGRTDSRGYTEVSPGKWVNSSNGQPVDRFDEYTPRSGKMSLDEIRTYAGPNASTNSSDAGGTRQSAAPPANPSAANPSDSSDSNSGSSGSNDNKQPNPVSDQKATGEGSAPGLSEIPVSHQDLGLAVINSYDL